MSDCMAFVLAEGTAQDEDQALAICLGIWDEGRSRQPARQGVVMGEKMERRAFVMRDLQVEEPEEGTPRIVGYAAVFDQLSEDLGGFRERIRPGAFSKTIEENDVRALWQHNPELVLGRMKNNTLVLHEDEIGLRMEAEPPETAWAQDALVSIKRGDVDQMSFGFMTIRDEWLNDAGGNVIRTLIEVDLLDVSPVTFPAYPQTSAAVRAQAREMAAAGEPAPEAGDGQGQDSGEGQEPHPEGGKDWASTQGRLNLMRRRLDLAERL